MLGVQKFRKLLYSVLTLCFLLGMIGFFLGRQSVEGLRLTTQHPADTQGPERVISPDSRESGLPAGERLDLNLATLEELMALPGIGEVRAQRILAYREAHGPFRHAADLMNVSGIGEGIFSNLRDYIYVEDDHENTDH